jgi:hypothetical protein
MRSEEAIRDGLPTDKPEVRSSARQAADSEPLLKMNIDLLDHARDRAVKSGVAEPEEGDLAALREHAVAMANETRREKFDPDSHAHDSLRQKEYEKKIRDREEAELAEKHAFEDYRDKKERADRAKYDAPKSEASGLVLASGVAVTSLTVIPTLHDFLGLADDSIAWAVSTLFGVFVGLLIAWSILTNGTEGSKSKSMRWMGLLGGVTLSIGLLLVRMSASRGTEEALIAIGLTLMEVGAILLMEMKALEIDEATAKWASQTKESKEQTAMCEVSRQVLERRAEKREGLDKWLDGHRAYVEERSIRNLNAAEITASADKSVVDGYSDGLAANRRYLRGVRLPNGHK